MNVKTKEILERIKKHFASMSQEEKIQEMNKYFHFKPHMHELWGTTKTNTKA